MLVAKACGLLVSGRLPNDAVRHFNGGANETTPISESGRCRRRSRNDCQSGDRTVVAGLEVAIDRELAEITRYALGDLRASAEICFGSDRRKIPNPTLRGR